MVAKTSFFFAKDGDLSAGATRVLATRFYLLSLQYRLNGCPLSQLLNAIFKEEANGRGSLTLSQSLNFYKNMRGVPIKNRRIVEQINRSVPGSKRNLYHPLWQILALPGASLQQVYQLMAELDRDVSIRLLKTDSYGNIVRKRHPKPQELHLIAQKGTLDGLAYCLLFMREMELLKCVDAYIEAKWATRHCFNLLICDRLFFCIAHKLYELLDRLFIAKNNPLPDYLQSHWSKAFPQKFNTPDSNEDIVEWNNVNMGILYHAEQKGFVGQNLSEQNRFLYIILAKHRRYQIEAELKDLPYRFRYEGNRKDLAEPLRSLMADVERDNRHTLIKSEYLDISPCNANG